MLFNADKCKVMHVGYNNKQAEYDMNDVKLESVSDEKDLGVIISKDLKWEKQCSEAVRKTNRMLGMIECNFIDRSKETIILLHKSLVRPLLTHRRCWCYQLIGQPSATARFLWLPRGCGTACHHRPGPLPQY